MNNTNKEGPSSTFSLLLGLILIAGMIGTGLIIRQMGGGGGTPEKDGVAPARPAAGSPGRNDSDKPDGIEGVQMPFYPRPGGGPPGPASPPRTVTSPKSVPRQGTVPGRVGRKSTQKVRERSRMVQPRPPMQKRERTQRPDSDPGEVPPDDIRRLEESLRTKWEQHPEMWEHIPPEEREAAFQKYREQTIRRVEERAKNIESPQN